MDSVDRATLIDFALGRLKDADAAELERRAESDAEFARTLDALRREILSLEFVRPDALRSLARRAPFLESRFLTAPQDENGENAFSGEETPLAETGESCEFASNSKIDAEPTNAVKVRRVGPAYPFYDADDELDSSSSAAASSVVFPASSSVAETSFDEDGAPRRFSEKIENDEDCVETENDENHGEYVETENDENNEEYVETENDENNEEYVETENDENNEEYVETENDENNEEYVETENDENNEEYVETENDKNNKEYVETEIDENRVETTTAPRRSQRFPFIPKFVVAPGSRRRSPFVAKRARFLDDAGLNDDVFDVSSSETPPRCDAFAAREIASENAEFAEIDLDKNATVAEIDLDENATVAEIDLDESFGAPRAPLAVEDEPVEPASLVPVASLADDASTNAIAQTPVSTACDAELSIAAEPSIAETSSSAAEQAEPFASDAQFNDFNDFNDFAPRTTSAERRLAELLGREPTPAEREEYYWETLDDEEPNDATEPKRRTQILRTAARVASEPAVAVGRATLAFCGAGSRRVLRETGLRRVLRGDDAIAATPTRRRRQPGQISDMMISTVSGVLIAVFIVFPMILAGFKDLFKTIAGSAVRKIGGVSVSETAPETDGFFFIADPLTRPTFESFEPTPLRETLLRETISDVKSRSVDEDDALVDAPLEDPLDPASTPPTLAPVPADLNAPYEKPF